MLLVPGSGPDHVRWTAASDARRAECPGDESLQQARKTCPRVLSRTLVGPVMSPGCCGGGQMSTGSFSSDPDFLNLSEGLVC